MVSPFDVLGVKVSASEAEIQGAYRQLAKQFHPDQHPGSSPAEQMQFEQAMSNINAAYEELKDAASRAEWVRRSEGEDSIGFESAESGLRAPVAGECLLCGSAPARIFHFRHQNAYLLGGTQYSSDISMCRSCALSFGRSKQNRTLWTGWWGILAFFRNFAVIWGNAQELRAANGMPSPAINPAVVAPLESPLNPGKPLIKRSGVWATGAAVALVVVAAVVSSTTDATRNELGEIESAGDLSVFSAQVGDCLNVPDNEEFGSFDAVPCAQPHDGEIIHEFDMRDGDFPSEAEFDDVALPRCLNAFEQYVGISFDESIYELFPVIPTEESWREDDTEVLCVAAPPSGRISKSIENSFE